jgi:hypothetical protein
MVGYGISNGVEYFKIRNSWGENRRELGYIYEVRETLVTISHVT